MATGNIDTTSFNDPLFFSSQVTILDHTSRSSESGPGDKDFDLMSIRLVVTNAIVNPWLYIVFRKENLNRILSVVRQIKYSMTSRSDNERQPILELP